MSGQGAIRQLAGAGARDAVAGTLPGGTTLVCDVNPAYYARLETLRGPPYLDLQAWEFRRAFETALVAANTADASA